MTNVVDIYAKALLESEISYQSIENACQMLEENEILWEALCNPSITKKEKQSVIQRLFTQEMANVLEVLCEHGKIALLFEIKEAYCDLLRQREGIGTATVYYTILPDASQKEAIAQMLCKVERKKEFILDWKEDQTLLGGICIQCGHKQYDRSVKNSLNLLRKNLLQGVKA